MYRIYSTQEYALWFKKLTLKLQTQIEARLERILNNNHFGDTKILDQIIAELRWKNGTRIYFSISKDENGELIILLLGGNKNSQRKDINRARNLLQEIIYEKI